jgi:transcriptional regulator with XRE-family HTH domain
MHQDVVKKIKLLRKEKGFDSLDMAEKLHITKSAYERLESGKTLTWSKYLEDILNIFEVTIEDFFNDIGRKVNITNKKGSFGNSYNAKDFNFDNKKAYDKLENLYKEIIKEKNDEIQYLKNYIEEKDKIIYSKSLMYHKN